MSNVFAAFQDITEAIKYGATAELLTNRGVINQVHRECCFNQLQQIHECYKWFTEDRTQIPKLLINIILKTLVLLSS